MDDLALSGLAGRLLAVPGVVAVALGGSRARGDHLPTSDVDLGLYYRPPLDVVALGKVASELSGSTVDVTPPGGWGPWVDGGAWVDVAGTPGTPVDLIYRDLDRVHQVWADCREGRFSVHAQAGHPAGFYSHAYAGEVALGTVLADPSGALAALRTETLTYPDALGRALVDATWEAGFCLDVAAKAVRRSDSLFVAACVARAFVVLVQALHGRAGQWLVHEKGSVTSAERLPDAPASFAARAQQLLGHVGGEPPELARTLAQARSLVADTTTALGSRVR